MPKRVSPEDRVIRVSIGLPQRILDAIDEVVDEYNALARQMSEPELNRSQYIGQSLMEAYGSEAMIEYLKAQIGIVQTSLKLKAQKAGKDLKKESKGKK